MLSIENPPPDPNLSSSNSDASSSSDERTPQKLALPEVDLSSKAVLDDTPLPKFSIRDYVFSARNKDISNNWPFSSKNLMLCLKHGVKDLLPPFQPIDIVRNQSVKGSTLESSTPEEKNTSNSSGEVPGPNKHVISGSLDNYKLNKKNEQIWVELNSCRSETENGLAFIATSVSQSEIESVPTNRPASSPLETETFSEVPAEVEASGLHLSRKRETINKPLGKKCRLVRKSGNNLKKTLAEDIASNYTTISETMTSKICPVCKTFASSSNTTLNAHIDQCLSLESTPKWTLDPKLTRHRVKPRKTKLMVDIYTTALPCTLEELDRRNGTNWAAVSSLTTQDIKKLEVYPRGKRQRVSIHPEDTGSAGAIYIDANGTKLRSLSEFNDAPSHSKVQEDLDLRKPLKGGKGNKIHSVKKKKCHEHQEYLNLAANSKTSSSLKDCSSQIDGVEKGHSGVEERSKMGEHQIRKQEKHHNSGTLRQWVCSKRTCVAKKSTSKEDHQPLKCKWHVSRDLLVETEKLYPVDCQPERSLVEKQTNFSKHPRSSPGNSERMDNPLKEANISDKRGWSPGRKRVGSPLFGEMISNSSLSPLERRANQLRKHSTFLGHDSCLNNKRRLHVTSVNNSDISPDSRTNPSRNSHKIALEVAKFSSLRKNVLSAVGNQSSMTGSMSHVAKRSRVHIRPDIDEEDVVASDSEAGQQCSSLNKSSGSSGKEWTTDDVSPRRSSALLKTKYRAVNSKTVALKTSASARKYYRRSEAENIDYSVRVGAAFIEKVDGFPRKFIQIHEENNIIKPSSRIAVEETATSLCQSVDPGFHKLINNFTNMSNTIQPTEKCFRPSCGVEALGSPTALNFVERREMYHTNEEASNGMIGQNVQNGKELVSEVRLENSFPAVDPIPIPGPPGSFLPSPGGMESDDFQGNSSLTSSLVQYSQDQQDFIDGDPSNSSISATSTISNSTEARFGPKYSEQLSPAGPGVYQEKIRSETSDACPEPLVQNAAAAPQGTCTGAESIAFDGENFKGNNISIEKGPLSFRDDDQPCCCQRKDKISWDVSSNYQEPQLITRHQQLASGTMPTMGEQMGYNLNTRPTNLDATPETFHPITCPSSSSMKVIMPENYPEDPFSSKASPSNGVNCNRESFSPSTSNPVLRLMGKNLMVVKKDEDASVRLEHSQPHSKINYFSSQVPTIHGVPAVNIRNQDYHFFHHRFHQGSLIDQDPCNTTGKKFDVKLSKGFRNRTNLVTPQKVVQGPAGLFLNQTDDRYMASMESKDYKGNNNMLAPSSWTKCRPNEASMYNIDGAVNFPDPQQRKSQHSVANSIKEVNIVIDDLPDCEANMTTNIAQYSGGLRASLLPSGSPVPMSTICNSRNVKPLISCYQYPGPVMHNVSFQSMASQQAYTNPPVRRGFTSEGPGVILERRPFVAVPSPTSRLRSSQVLYNSPS